MLSGKLAQHFTGRRERLQKSCSDSDSENTGGIYKKL